MKSAKTSKGRKNKRGRATKVSSKEKELAVTAKRLCGITDPFCVHAKGAADPIGSNTQTITWTTRAQLTVTTGTNCAFLLVDPEYKTE